MSRRSRLTLLSSVAAVSMLSLSVGSVLAQDDTMADDDAMASMEPGITVRDQWTRESLMLDLAGAAYMIIHNGTDAEDRLIGASSPAAGVVELHETSTDADGAMAMAPVTEIVLAPHADTRLEPGGFHIMLIDLVGPLVEGDQIELDLEFATAGSQTISLPVAGPMGMEMDDSADMGMGDSMDMDADHGDMGDEGDMGMGDEDEDEDAG